MDYRYNALKKWDMNPRGCAYLVARSWLHSLHISTSISSSGGTTTAEPSSNFPRILGLVHDDSPFQQIAERPSHAWHLVRIYHRDAHECVSYHEKPKYQYEAQEFCNASFD